MLAFCVSDVILIMLLSAVWLIVGITHIKSETVYVETSEECPSLTAIALIVQLPSIPTGAL